MECFFVIKDSEGDQNEIRWKFKRCSMHLPMFFACKKWNSINGRISIFTGYKNLKYTQANVIILSLKKSLENKNSYEENSNRIDVFVVHFNFLQTNWTHAAQMLRMKFINDNMNLNLFAMSPLDVKWTKFEMGVIFICK